MLNWRVEAEKMHKVFMLHNRASSVLYNIDTRYMRYNIDTRYMRHQDHQGLCLGKVAMITTW